MKVSGRVLTVSALLIGAAILVTLIVGAVLSGLNQPLLLDENTPEGVIQRYFIAIDEGRYLSAYEYIAPPAGDYDFEAWKHSFIGGRELPAFRISLGLSTVKAAEANVEVIIETFRPGNPFGSSINTNHVYFSLKYFEERWLITSPVDIWWMLY